MAAIWTPVFHLASWLDRQADPQLGQEFAQAGNQDLARQDDQRRQHVDAAAA